MTDGWIDVDSPSILPVPVSQSIPSDRRRLGKGRLRLEPGRARSNAVLLLLLLLPALLPPRRPLPGSANCQGEETAHAHERTCRARSHMRDRHVDGWVRERGSVSGQAGGCEAVAKQECSALLWTMRAETAAAGSLTLFALASCFPPFCSSRSADTC